MKNELWDDNRLSTRFSQLYRSSPENGWGRIFLYVCQFLQKSPGPPPDSGELFAVFPGAAIPAPGLTPQKGRETSHNCTHEQKDHIPHFRPPQAAAGGLRPHAGGAPRPGYSPPRFYRMTILPVNVSLVNIRLILINADSNGLRPSAIPEENHFPKPGVCGIMNNIEPVQFNRAMLLDAHQVFG